MRSTASGDSAGFALPLVGIAVAFAALGFGTGYVTTADVDVTVRFLWAAVLALGGGAAARSTRRLATTTATSESDRSMAGPWIAAMVLVFLAGAGLGVVIS